MRKERMHVMMEVEKSHDLVLQAGPHESQWYSSILSLKTSTESRGISGINPNPRAEDQCLSSYRQAGSKKEHISPFSIFLFYLGPQWIR